MTRRALPLLLAATALTAAVARAQTTRPYAAVRGYVFDSLLTNGTVPGAKVTLTGPTTKTITADARGRFTTDSLEPGRYTITFTDQRWEEIGYQPAAQQIELRAGVYTSLFLSSTAGAEIADRVCPGPREANRGVVLGGLTDIASRAVVGAEIRVEWNERVISKELGFTNYRRVARATTDSGGRYAICSVPNDTPMLFRATVAGVDGPPLELDLKSRPLAVKVLTVDPGTLRGDSLSRVRGAASLRGTIKATDGSPLPEAQVLVLGLEDVATTSATGAFQIDSLPAGTRTVEIRAIGFARQRHLVDLRPDRPATVDLRLVRMAVVLPEVEVRVAARLSEFDRRRTTAAGAGHFITREEILQRNPRRTEELFRTVPGFSVEPSGGFDFRVVSSRGSTGSSRCSPDFFIDGVRAIVDPQVGGGLPMNPEQIYGIESYSSNATTPAEYQSQSGCGAIIIWTRRGERNQPRP